MGYTGKGNRLAIGVVSALVSAAAMSPAAAASAPGVPYFHDFLGGVCVRDQDLETAYLLGTKGVRPPPLCIEDPCEALLERDTYERDILGRPASDAEWADYESMQALVCAEDAPTEVLTMLLPFDYDLDDPIAASDPLEVPAAGADVLAYVLPWVNDGPSFIDHRRSIGRRGLGRADLSRALGSEHGFRRLWWRRVLGQQYKQQFRQQYKQRFRATARAIPLAMAPPGIPRRQSSRSASPPRCRCRCPRAGSAA